VPITWSISATLNAVIAFGVRARAKSLSAAGRLTSSRVRMDRMQATSCSKTDS